MEQNEEQWTIEKIEEALKTGIVSFEFERVDGTIRSALGTLVPEMLPDRMKEVKDELVELARSTEEMTPYGMVGELHRLGGKIRAMDDWKGETKKRLNTVSYYDLQKGAFRSFNFGRLVEVKEIWPYGK